MNKKVILLSILSALFFVSCNSSDEEKYDSRAVESLDNLTETIGDLASLSYTVNSMTSDEKGEENFKISDVYLKGPNKMFIKNNSSYGDKSFWYNGEKFAYFLFDKNEYDILDAPDNTLKVIDSLNNKYGIYFPAADFLYPTLTDDMIDFYDQILFYGDDKIDGINCVSLEASNDFQTVFLWINKEANLPYKMVITYKNSDKKYYEAIYTNWRKDPKLPEVMFEFKAPEGSERKKFTSKNLKTN